MLIRTLLRFEFHIAFWYHHSLNFGYSSYKFKQKIQIVNIVCEIGIKNAYFSLLKRTKQLLLLVTFCDTTAGIGSEILTPDSHQFWNSYVNVN